jgi:ribonuclease P protein subunit RPR2
MKRGSKPGWIKELAKKRINRLLELAGENLKKHPERTRRYVELARKLSSKYNTSMSGEQKRQLCRKCDAFLVPGLNLSVRADAKIRAQVYTCLECGNARRYGY